MKEAMFYKKADNDAIACYLCNHNCKIKPDNTGICKVRKNISSNLYSMVYSNIVAQNIDPVEKKPLYHFLSGSYTFSISTVGCNFKCKHCQNYEISQVNQIFGKEIAPENIVLSTIENKLNSISFTYTEPTIYYETAYDIGILGKEKGLKNIFVSNGFMNKKIIPHLSEWLDAINIDIKSFNEDFYKNICGASLKPVLENVVKLKEAGIWVEITTLIIPGYNDSAKELKDIAKFIKSVDSNIPWHVSAFYPTYLLTDTHPTPPEKVIEARIIGLEQGLNFVYTGNIRDNSGSNTYCPGCNELLIERRGYMVKKRNFENGICKNCGKVIEGIWS